MNPLQLLIAGCVICSIAGLACAVDENPLDKQPANTTANESNNGDDNLPLEKPATPEEVLKSKGLARLGILYLLEVDTKIENAMRFVRLAKKKYEDDDRKRLELEKQVKIAKAAISDWDDQYRVLSEKLGGVQDTFQHNRIVGQINSLASKIKKGIQFIETCEKELAKVGTSHTAYVNTVIDVWEDVDKTNEAYKALATDQDVQTAITQINEKAKPKLKLGPSSDFTRQYVILKAWRDGILTDRIKPRFEGNVPYVDVNLNGTLTRSMVLDSGAGMVTVTAELAKQLGLVPGKDDIKIKLILADGKVVEAHQMMLKSVSLGQFKVDNVECAVLPANLVSAQDLLGGSFLKHFVYTLDPVAGELKMSQVRKAGDTPTGRK